MESAGCIISADKHFLEHRTAFIRSLCGRSVVLFVQRDLQVRRRTQADRSVSRIQTITGQQELFVLRHRAINLADMDRRRISGNVRRHVDIVGKDSGVLHQLSRRTSHKVSAHGVSMRLVTRAEKLTQTRALSIGEIEHSRSIRQVNKRHVLLGCYHTHRLHITHRQIIRRHALVLFEFAVFYLRKLIAKVMLSFTSDIVSAEIRTADRSNEHRRHAQCTRFIDK